MKNKYSGKLIVFEGLDCSFKETNSEKLYKYVYGIQSDKEGTAFPKVEQTSFPRYFSPASYFVKEYLAGEYGKQDNLTSETIAMCYMMDMFDYMTKRGIELLENGYTVILDRYWFSNLYYREGYIREAKAEEDNDEYSWIIDTLDKRIMEVATNLNLPFPDMVIKMISCGNAIKDKLKAKASGDLHESDIKYMMYVKEAFDSIDFREYGNRFGYDTRSVDIVVSNDTKDGKYTIKSKEDIFNDVKYEYDCFVKSIDKRE